MLEVCALDGLTAGGRKKRLPDRAQLRVGAFEHRVDARLRVGGGRGRLSAGVGVMAGLAPRNTRRRGRQVRSRKPAPNRTSMRAISVHPAVSVHWPVLRALLAGIDPQKERIAMTVELYASPSSRPPTSLNLMARPERRRGRGGGAPNIFRASGPNRNSVVLECLRLVRRHGCVVRTLAGKVFDGCEFSLVAEVLGEPAARLALATDWDASFPHETAKTDSKRQYAPVQTISLGTHFIEATGPDANAALDVLDLVSGEFNVPINVAFVRRARRCGSARRYLVQLVINLPASTRANVVCRAITEWGAKPGRRTRLIPLMVPPELERVVRAGRTPKGKPPLRTAADRPVLAEILGVDSHRSINFPGGVDLV